MNQINNYAYILSEPIFTTFIFSRVRYIFSINKNNILIFDKYKFLKIKKVLLFHKN